MTRRLQGLIKPGPGFLQGKQNKSSNYKKIDSEHDESDPVGPGNSDMLYKAYKCKQCIEKTHVTANILLAGIERVVHHIKRQRLLLSKTPTPLPGPKTIFQN